MAVSVGILIGIGVGIVALFLAAILLPEVFFHKPDQDFATKDRVDARGTLRTSLVQAIGGATTQQGGRAPMGSASEGGGAGYAARRAAKALTMRRSRRL